ncbi:MAG: glycoside hydrolase family 3 C-terminal domain-containing protein [Brevefilum sp.]|nr:glycoside hydrolase family 3 C-terminal domain-containing protein [Brevefilum sp.]
MPHNPHLLHQFSNLVRTDNGVTYRDLNKNGILDAYEDPRQPIDARVEDLLRQMTLAEKAGALFINGAVVNEDASLDERPLPGSFGLSAKIQMQDQLMNHFNLWDVPDAAIVARWHNRLQQFAEETRLGIPVTIASDPRSHFSRSIYEMQARDFSQWCQPLGMAAVGDEALVWQFANYVRQEYLAVGMRVALHPQIDLATEPRWPRINGTFGEDAELSARLAAAYIAGFQGEALGPESVACMTKHFPGGGPQKDGLDPHFPFHQGQVYPGDNFDYHLIPFKAAIAAKTAAIMPYYGVPMDQTDENVGMAYNHAIIKGLLRQDLGYDGLVCSDWGLVTDLVTPEFTWPARAWGVEHLSEVERVAKILNAGVDMFGGESCPAYVIEALEAGLVSLEQVDQSVRRVLHLKFALGLFDNPFCDPADLNQVIGNPDILAAGLASQTRAMTLLKNDHKTLPLRRSPRLYIENMAEEVVRRYADVVSSPEDADFILMRLSTPWTPAETEVPFGRNFHHGDLDFKGEEKDAILRLLAIKPAIVVIELDRPAVIPEISARATALLGDFGASDEAVMKVVFGEAAPEGKLPFELPSSMDAVRAQRTDVPFDSEDPLYPFGYGLRYG